jgi:hypothetical protein
MEEETTEIVRPEGEDPRPVDMVVYFGTERIVVGKAGMNADGTFTAVMNETVDPRVHEVIGYVYGEFSFGLPRVFKPRFQSEFTAGELPFDGDVPEQPEDIVRPVDQ